MTAQPPIVLAMTGVTKSFNAPRPLRVRALTVGEGERVSIGGLDAGVSELLVNLVTGASLPDAGEVHVFGTRTADIGTGDEWLDSLDRFGIVSPRGVLLEGSTLRQNLAMPFTLSIDPIPPEVEAQIRELTDACGIDARCLDVRAGDAPADVRVRAHLARALALRPSLVIVEHPTADVPAEAKSRLAADIARACSRPGLTTVLLTNDEGFASAVAPRNLLLHGATGDLKPLRRKWFG